MWTVFALPNLRWRAFQKLHLYRHPCLAARRLQKFCEDTHTSPEVIEAHTLNFRTNFKFLQLNVLTLSPVGCSLGSLGQSLMTVKI